MDVVTSGEYTKILQRPMLNSLTAYYYSTLQTRYLHFERG